MLARRHAGLGLRWVIAWQILRNSAQLGFSVSFAVLVGKMIAEGVFSPLALACSAVCLAAAGVMSTLSERSTAQTEAKVVTQLQLAAQTSLSKMSLGRIQARAPGALIASLERHPLALAGEVVSHTAAKMMAALGPLLAAGTIAFVSWQAAAILILSLPIMLTFFVLVGSAVRTKAQSQETAFGHVAGQFSDRIRVLPTILAAHGFQREHAKVEMAMRSYADSTMALLRIAFLNAGIIDLFAALSIAALAVLLGLDHLGLMHLPGFTELKLWQSLLILIVAAEFFTPFRRYAEQYHAKAEGEAAANELDWFFSKSAVSESRMPLSLPAIDALPASGLVALSGPSGSGKSTILRMLAGLEPPACGLSPLADAGTRGFDWIAGDIFVPPGTLADAIAWEQPNADDRTLYRAARAVDLIDDRLLPGGLAAGIQEGGQNLSGGQRMRIGVARALLSDRTVLADEPTAKLDAASARLVRKMLREMASRRLVVVATHDEELIALADIHQPVPSNLNREQAAAA